MERKFVAKFYINSLFYFNQNMTSGKQTHPKAGVSRFNQLKIEIFWNTRKFKSIIQLNTWKELYIKIAGSTPLHCTLWILQVWNSVKCFHIFCVRLLRFDVNHSLLTLILTLCTLLSIWVKWKNPECRANAYTLAKITWKIIIYSRYFCKTDSDFLLLFASSVLSNSTRNIQ